MRLRRGKWQTSKKPYLVKRKYYSEQYFSKVAFFEDMTRSRKEFGELRAISLRDWVQIVDVRTGHVMADSRAE